MRITALDDLQHARAVGVQSLFPSRPKMVVGTSSCGLAVGAGDVWEAVAEESDEVQVRATGCFGFCQREPIVAVLDPGKPKMLHGEVTPERAVELRRALAKRELRFDTGLCRIDEEQNILDETTIRYLTDPEAVPKNGVPDYDEVPFFSKQLRIVMRNCGIIDPRNIEEYIARGGYFTLWRVLHEMLPEQVIAQITASGLRGRGGAGFPTGRKWQLCREAEGDIKYLVCNADEGDPGAYMDRIVLESDPHSVLEGMIIGAYAIGCRQGYIYVRAEYPLAMKIVQTALDAARERGLLGENIMGSGFSFDVEMVKGAGAFVCGEETALLAAIEGRVGEPRQRPPYPAECGLWEKPTNINNVKTWANVPVIMTRGAEWFSGIGTDRSKGTMVFSLVGKVKNTGLVEVPMGITLRELVYDIGDGIADGKAFKAVQTGGPSGGCIPEELLDLAVDYEQLTEAGSMMGSGGMVVMDEETCMVDMARYFLSFTKEESCGKCTPCREGTKHMLDTLTRICEGKGQEGDIELLEELGKTTKAAAGCGLGGTAPNPVLTTLRYFRDEYRAHVQEGKCPGGVCTALIQYSINAQECRGCGRCQSECPAGAIRGKEREPRIIAAAACSKCGVCRDVCRAGAVMVT